ncbi:MAG: DUF4263 domain-containing protein [Gemmataceae bacterium]
MSAMLQKPELSERKDVLPFFRSRDQLCALIGEYVPNIARSPLVAHEFGLLNDYRADLFVGDRDEEEYLAVEFEDGKRESIFRAVKGRSTKEWSPRFEHGYSQLIDWFATLDDYKKTDKFRREFGTGHVRFTGLLVIGRSAALTPDDRSRLRWRSDRVMVDSHSIHCVTFDDLYEALRKRLARYTLDAK